MRWVWRWAAASNERAVANARTATTVLSRMRVERTEVELYCRRRYAPKPVLADVEVAAARR